MDTTSVSGLLLDPQQWHRAITAGTTVEQLAAKVGARDYPEWARPLLAHTQEGDVLLELGSGTGELSAICGLHDRRVHLVDYSQESLDFAKQLFDRLAVEGRFSCQDMCDGLSLESDSVDWVFSSGVLEHFSDEVNIAILTDSARVARKGVMSLVPNANSLCYRIGKHKMEQEESWIYGHEDPKATMRHLFEAAGLQDVEEYSVAPFHALEFWGSAHPEIVRFLASLPPTARDQLNQGYLLFTIGRSGPWRDSDRSGTNGLGNRSFSARTLPLGTSVISAMHYEAVRPNATYAPWRDDPEFVRVLAELRGHTLVDRYRCFELWELVGQASHLPGNILEVGVWRGGTGALIAARAMATASEKTVYLCDTFAGVVKATDKDTAYQGGEHADTTEEIVAALLSRLEIENVRIVKGVFPDDHAQAMEREQFCFVHIDVDVFQSAKDVLDFVWPRMPVGGIVVFDDYGFPSCAGIPKLVNEHRGRQDMVVLHNLNGHAVLVKIKA